MKRQRFLIGLLCLVLAPTAWAELILGPGSKLWLEGDSTLHRYSSTAERINFSAEVSSSAPAQVLTPEALIRGRLVRGLRVAVSVEGLKSGKSGLDANLRRTLNAEQHPDIVFTMSDYRVEASSAQDRVSVRGTLNVAGKDKMITLDASLRWRDGNAVIDGERDLLMTDFGMEPPKLMMGALRTDDKVVVKFHLELEQAAGQPPARAGKEEL